MRKLATIATIENIRNHPNADELELVTIRGWQVVVKKGEFKNGQRCVYCEIDSVLPPRPEFAFLERRQYRIKTIRLRGELSQGICFPISIIPVADYVALQNDDATEVLGITLYQPPEAKCLGGDALGVFPSFIPKTDQYRIQNIYHWVIQRLPDIEWFGTEKLDGSSCTMFMHKGVFGVCSRNLQLKPSESSAYWEVARKYEVERKLQGLNVAVQGELIGPKIQGNPYGLKEYQWRVFDVFDLDCAVYRNGYLNPDDFVAFCKTYQFETVPLLFKQKLPPSIEQILLDAEGKSALNHRAEREGLVWKPMREINYPRIERVSFKAISNRFLLKQKE